MASAKRGFTDSCLYSGEVPTAIIFIPFNGIPKKQSGNISKKAMKVQNSYIEEKTLNPLCLHFKIKLSGMQTTV